MSLLESARPLAARHRLVVWIDGAEQAVVLPERGTAIVGRTRESDVTIASPTVSRRHAQISVRDKAVLLLDLDSRNGTRVNGERLSSEYSLSYGDVITFGNVTGAIEEEVASQSSSRLRPSVIEGPHTLDLGGINVIVEDAAMRHAYMQLERLAKSDLSVLLTGETGSGKELAAQALRFWSKRREHPLVSINCAAMPEGIAESELFGYEKGAFSGAAGSKIGLLESAPGGTIFLDEIGDLSLTVQAKLLRVLENRCITRLGAVRERPIDVRVVSATHRDLMADARTGRFRQDLYYRLSAGIVHLPPLRVRHKELPLLARRFLDEGCHKLGKDALTLTEAALKLMSKHAWPGNVRELKNLMEYAAAVVEHGPVAAEHIAPRLAEGEAPVPSGAMPAPAAHVTASPSLLHGPEPLVESKRVFERRRIEAALLAAGGNKSKAARTLGVPLRTFMDKVKRHGLG